VTEEKMTPDDLQEYSMYMKIESAKLAAMVEALKPVIHRADRGIINCDELVYMVIKEFRDFGYEI
jgi:hypothetical protein